MKLKTLLTAFLLFFTLSVGSVLAQSQNSVEGDRQALVDLYNATNGDNWDNNSGWLSGNPSSDWFGIEVDANGRVTRIDLNANNLNGSLPESIGNLNKVTYFDIEANSLVGDIPSSIGNMTSLVELWMAGNQSNKPDFGSAGYHPGKVDVSSNRFTGQIPTTVGNLTNLEIFRLERQGDMSGPIPSEFGNCTKLRALLLYGEHNDHESGFTGQLPASLGNLRDLVFLSFGRNHITGPIPEEYGNMVSLRYLEGGASSISSLPSTLTNTNLKHLWFDQTYIDMPFPEWVFEGHFPELTTFAFGWPQDGAPGFSGTLENLDFTTTPQLDQFSVSGHVALTGDLPESVTTLDPVIFNVAWTAREGKGVGGEIPQEGWADWNIRNLRLNDNNFEGPIPVGITEMTGMRKQIDFQGNKFVFADIIPVLEAGGQEGFEFDEQKPFGHAKTVNLSAGQTFTVDFTHKSHEDDRYQWTKDGDEISGETSAILTISNVSESDAGEYRLEMTNSNVSHLGTLVSEPITFSISN